MKPGAVRILGGAIVLGAVAVLVYHFALSSEPEPSRVELALEPAPEDSGEPADLTLSDNTRTILLRLILPQGTEIGRHRVEISASGGGIWESGGTLAGGATEIEVELPAARLARGRHEVVVVRERKRREDAAVARYAFQPRRVEIEK